jgi:hypothetical protein
MVQTNSYERKIRVQIFEGVVQLWEREELDLKKNHRLIIGSCKQQSPSLCWKVTKSCLYTLVITLYGEPNPSDVQVDLQIIIEG